MTFSRAKSQTCCECETTSQRGCRRSMTELWPSGVLHTHSRLEHQSTAASKDPECHALCALSDIFRAQYFASPPCSRLPGPAISHCGHKSVNLAFELGMFVLSLSMHTFTMARCHQGRLLVIFNFWAQLDGCKAQPSARGSVN